MLTMEAVVADLCMTGLVTSLAAVQALAQSSGTRGDFEPKLLGHVLSSMSNRDKGSAIGAKVFTRRAFWQQAVDEIIKNIPGNMVRMVRHPNGIDKA